MPFTEIEVAIIRYWQYVQYLKNKYNNFFGSINILVNGERTSIDYDHCDQKYPIPIFYLNLPFREIERLTVWFSHEFNLVTFSWDFRTKKFFSQTFLDSVISAYKAIGMDCTFPWKIHSKNNNVHYIPIESCSHEDLSCMTIGTDYAFYTTKKYAPHECFNLRITIPIPNLDGSFYKIKTKYFSF